MARALRFALLLCLLGLPAPAAALMFEFAGVIEGVRDDLDSLDASVAVDVPVSGTYVVDLTTSSGGSPFEVGPGSAQLTFSLGGYVFDASQATHAIALINNRVVLSATLDLWQSREITLSDLSGPSAPTANHGAAFAGYAAQIEFNDYDAVVFDGTETQPFVPDDVTGAPGIADWDEVILPLTRLEQNGAAPPALDNRVQVGVIINSWTPVPEPRSAALLALGLASLAHQRRRARDR
jgi:hypothetical protein